MRVARTPAQVAQVPDRAAAPKRRVRARVSGGIGLAHDLAGVVDGIRHAVVAAQRAERSHRAARVADEAAEGAARQIGVAHDLIAAVDPAGRAVRSAQRAEVAHALSVPQEGMFAILPGVGTSARVAEIAQRIRRAVASAQVPEVLHPASDRDKRLIAVHVVVARDLAGCVDGLRGAERPAKPGIDHPPAREYERARLPRGGLRFPRDLA